jgi:hypothetical protein
MTSKYDYVVCSIEESNDLDTMSIDELQSSLLVHEQRISRHMNDEQALQITHGFQQGGRGGGRGTYRGRGRGRGRFGFDKSILECYYCHELGHFQWECPKRDKEQKANYAETKDEMLLMAFVDSNEIAMEHIWFLDSGRSNHMCGKQNMFFDLDKSFRESMKLGNDSSLTVQGKGNIRMEVNGFVHVITEVFYVPDLKNNLLSIGQLQEKGLTVLIQRGICKIFHKEKGLIMETTMTHNRMFTVHARYTPKELKCFSSLITDQTDLWHCRYGHLSWNGLKVLQQKNMVKGLPPFKASQKICENCLVGRQHRDPFPKASMWRASNILQLVHADICGPINPVSNGKKGYLITFIDDFSKKTWVYFLMEKSEALSTFKSYKARVEKETGFYIRSLRTDRGGEFTSQDFTDFYNEHGIHRQLMTAYTPQQNGVAERKNRTIMNMVRSMLTAKQISKTFLA